MIGQAIDFSTDRRIAEHIATMDWADIPAAAQNGAKRAVLWSLMNCLESATEPGQQTVIDYIRAHGGQEEATLIGFGMRATAEHAGLLNGRAGKAWEHEDKYWVDETIGFAVGCCVVPAAIAAAEMRGGVSGVDLMTAVALGIDLEARLLRPLGLGFVFGRTAANATFTLGNYGAAAAAARILGLDTDGILDAIGLAHGQSCGNYAGQAEGRGVSLQNGFAVRNGIAAARFAALGMPGAHAALTGPVGVFATHFPDCEIDLAQVTDGLGQDILSAYIGFKGYPCGVVAHPAIDAVLAARPDIGARRVTSIDFYGPPSLNIMSDPIEVKRAPKTDTEAQFSIPWAAACALKDGYFGIEHFQRAALESAEIRAFADLVSIHMDPGFVGTRLVITLDDGAKIEPPVVMAARGHPSNPLPTSDIEDQLRRAAARIGLEAGDVERAIELLAGLEDVADIAQVVALLSGPRDAVAVARLG